MKDKHGTYEPGKRHWYATAPLRRRGCAVVGLQGCGLVTLTRTLYRLKMKKDYLADGAMADTADLVRAHRTTPWCACAGWCRHGTHVTGPLTSLLLQVVVGAYFGTGSKGGIMSVFLMGTLDEASGKWRTVRARDRRGYSHTRGQ